MCKANQTDFIEQHDLIIIGGGPAGLAAAVAARRQGIEDILILEREAQPGGILKQCIHNGFGLHRFHEELTGPEYAQRWIDEASALGIPCRSGTMVIDLNSELRLTVTGRETGLMQLQAGAVILAMGCRERPRGALNIPGYRPAGIYSAGAAQRLINIEGRMPGREVVILGSGDIGLIMARRLTLEGAHVKAVAELMPYSSGLRRNIVQCLDDFGIPLKLSHTVVDIRGKHRVEGVVLAQVDANRQPIPDTEELIDCDTLLLSVGLLPENELSELAGVAIDPATSGPVVRENLETSVSGIFACGNVLHVHDLVDHVSEEAEAAGRAAADYLQGRRGEGRLVRVISGEGISGAVPQRIDLSAMPEKLSLRFRVRREVENHYLSLYCGNERLLHLRRRIMTPGQMEEISIGCEQLAGAREDIRIEMEEA